MTSTVHQMPADEPSIPAAPSVQVPAIARESAAAELNSLRDQGDAMRREVRVIDAATKALDTVVKALERQDLTTALKAVDDSALGAARPELVGDLRARIAEARESLVRDLDRHLVVALEAADLPIDASSRYPTLRIDDGLLEIRVDTKKRIAAVEARDGRPIRVPLEPSAIATTAVRERNRLLDHPLAGVQFLDQLASTADELADPETGMASLTDVRARLTESKELDRAAFNVNLSKALQGRVRTSDGRVPDLGHTKNVKKGVLIWRRDTGGYVGHIRFVRGGDDAD